MGRGEDTGPRIGEWQVVRGVLATAGFVALPVGLSTSHLVARWLLAAQPLVLTLLVTGLIWLLLAAWLLDGVHRQTRGTRG